MVKILLLAPIHHHENFRKQYKKNEKLLFPDTQGQYHRLEALKLLWHQVEVFRYTDIPYLWGYITSVFLGFCVKYFNFLYRLISRFFHILYFLSLWNYLTNHLLIKRIIAWNFDILLFSWGTNKIFPRTLAFIKKKYPRLKIVFLNGMAPVRFLTASEKKMVKSFDYVFTNDYFHAIDRKMLGVSRSYCLPISSINEKRKSLYLHEPKSYQYDVSFVGMVYGSRRNFLEQLIKGLDEKINFKIFAPTEAELWILLKKYYGWSVKGKEMFEVFRKTKINLNIHEAHMQYWWNMRTFEIPGSHSFQLVDRCPEDWFVDWKEIALFTSITDLMEKISFYLEHEQERRAIMNHGFERVYKDHTYQSHFNVLFKKIWC